MRREKNVRNNPCLIKSTNLIQMFSRRNMGMDIAKTVDCSLLNASYDSMFFFHTHCQKVFMSNVWSPIAPFVATEDNEK
jgi:hypothetical protein